MPPRNALFPSSTLQNWDPPETTAVFQTGDDTWFDSEQCLSRLVYHDMALGAFRCLSNTQGSGDQRYIMHEDNNKSGMVKFWDKICAFTPLWQLALAIIMMLLVLTVFSLAFVTPGTGSYYIVLFNLLLLGILTITDIGVLYVCKQYRQKELEGEKELETFQEKDQEASDVESLPDN